MLCYWLCLVVGGKYDNGRILIDNCMSRSIVEAPLTYLLFLLLTCGLRLRLAETVVWKIRYK